MASLSVPYSLLRNIVANVQDRNFFPRTADFSIIRCCCRSNSNNELPGDSENPNTKKKGKPESTRAPSQCITDGLEKLGKGLRDGLSPQRKGDWKDLALMSLSFAVYVYISQKIVCAYYAWISIPKHPW